MSEQLLERLGLTEREAKLYLAALEIGPSSVLHLAKKAGLNRPTTYVVIDSLMNQGLLTSHVRGKRTLYAAEPPSQLTSLLAARETEFASLKDELKKTLPELEAISSLATDRPRVKLYEGKAGVDAAYLDLLRSLKKGDSIYAFTAIDEMERINPQARGKRTGDRLRLGIKLKVIYTRTAGPLPDATDPQAKREARFVPKDQFPFDISITIVPDQGVHIMSYGEKLAAVQIQSPSIARSLKSFFDLAWLTAEQFPQK